MYTGANPSTPKYPNGQAYDVMKLTEPLHGKGYTVYTDNFYTSPVLFKDLLTKKLTTSGTNHKHVLQVLAKASGMKRGDSKFAFHAGLTAVRWHDNKDVYCLSTLISDSITSVERQVDKEKRKVTCPNIIANYNKYMGRVDLADQAMCSVGRKTMKWWRQEFWRVHDMAITSAFVLHKENIHGVVKPQKSFRMQLAYSFTAAALQLRKSLGHPHTTALARLSGKHFIYRSSVR